MPNDLIGKIKKQLKPLNDLRNVALYFFVLIVLAIAWSSVHTIQTNYELQKQITSLNQQNEVAKLSNGNIQLENQYYATDQYLELAARQSLGLAEPGEKVMLVPSSTAMKYIDPTLIKETTPQGLTGDTRSKYVKNAETWRDFLLGRKLETD